MRSFLTVAALLTFCLGGAAQGAPLLAKFVQAQTNVPTFDPNLFGPGPNVDVYHFRLSNPNSSPVTSLQINLCVPSSNLLNLNPSGLTFKTNADLPTLGPNKVAESFFVIPPTFSVFSILAVDVIDNAMTLSASYTRAGGGTFIPANSNDVTVAVLTVPTGSPAPYLRYFPFGYGAVNGVLEPFGYLGFPPYDDCVPEPTAALLAACGLAAASGRRH